MGSEILQQFQLFQKYTFGYWKWLFIQNSATASNKTINNKQENCIAFIVKNNNINIYIIMIGMIIWFFSQN